MSSADEGAAAVGEDLAETIVGRVEQLVRQAEASGMPALGPYAQELRTARYRGLPPLD